MDATIHIGTGKTGTTSLQKFFHLNRHELGNQGILYTKSLGFTNNIDFSMYGLTDSEISRSGYLIRNGVLSIEQKKSFDNHAVNRLRNEIDNAKGCSRVIVSSEHLSTDLRNKHNVERIKDLCELTGIKVKRIIVYIREQTSYIYSEFNTRVLMGLDKSYSPNIPTVVNNSVLNHFHTLSLWENIFPDVEIIVRIFDKKLLKDGDTIIDFANIENIDLSTFKQPEMTSNDSLSEDALRFLVDYNAAINNLQNKERLSIAKKEIYNILIPLCGEVFIGKALKPNSLIINQISTLFSEVNEKVRSKYFPDRSVLFNIDSLPSEIQEKTNAVNSQALVIAKLIDRLINT